VKVIVFFVTDKVEEKPLLEVELQDGRLVERSRQAGVSLRDFLLGGKFVRREDGVLVSVKEQPVQAFNALLAHFSGSRVRAKIAI